MVKIQSGKKFECPCGKKLFMAHDSESVECYCGEKYENDGISISFEDVKRIGKKIF